MHHNISWCVSFLENASMDAEEIATQSLFFSDMLFGVFQCIPPCLNFGTPNKPIFSTATV